MTIWVNYEADEGKKSRWWRGCVWGGGAITSPAVINNETRHWMAASVENGSQAKVMPFELGETEPYDV